MHRPQFMLFKDETLLIPVLEKWKLPTVLYRKCICILRHVCFQHSSTVIKAGLFGKLAIIWTLATLKDMLNLKQLQLTVFILIIKKENSDESCVLVYQ